MTLITVHRFSELQLYSRILSSFRLSVLVLKYLGVTPSTHPPYTGVPKQNQKRFGTFGRQNKFTEPDNLIFDQDFSFRSAPWPAGEVRCKSWRNRLKKYDLTESLLKRTQDPTDTNKSDRLNRPQRMVTKTQRDST